MDDKVDLLMSSFMQKLKYNSVYWCFLLVIMLGFVPVASVSAATLSQQRQMYAQALEDLKNDNPTAYLNYRQALAGYPLLPYLEYEEINRRIVTTSDEDVQRFLKKNDDLPQTKWLKAKWLTHVGERKDWALFKQQYQPDTGIVSVECMQGMHLYDTHQAIEANNLAEKLYLSTDKQPKACDDFFAQWQNQGGMTNVHRLARLKLASIEGNWELAKMILVESPSLKGVGERMLQVAQKPELLNQKKQYSEPSDDDAAVVSVGLRRLAKTNLNQAASLLGYYEDKLPFTDQDRALLAKDVGIPLARAMDPRALEIFNKNDLMHREAEVTEWRIRLELQQKNWKASQDLIQKLPKLELESNRWRYWQARTLELMNPNDPQSKFIYQDLAKERDYYGFLAAERANLPYNLDYPSNAVTQKTIKQVMQTPAIGRALELKSNGQAEAARVEWMAASKRFSKDEVVAQAKIAYDRKWFLWSIRTIGQDKGIDDLELRFPMEHHQTLLAEAEKNKIHPSWVFGVTRQESAFMKEARSSSGAMGLMQLMPATAKETAERNNIALASEADAYTPQTNIKLGTAYLRQLNQQFKGNRILVSAAYNAGPGRVRQWLKTTEHQPVDIWIESIPFDETRQYVQNVLAYSVIYGKKLNRPLPLIGEGNEHAVAMLPEFKH